MRVMDMRSNLLGAYSQAPQRLRDISLAELVNFLGDEYQIEVSTVSWRDTLLYPPLGSGPNGIPHELYLDKPLLEVALRAVAAEQSDPHSALEELKRRLRGKEFVLLQVSGRSRSAEEGGQGGGQDVFVPPVKIVV